MVPLGLPYDVFKKEFDEVKSLNKFSLGDPTLLFVGFLEPAHELGLLLEAFKRLKWDYPRAHLVIVGVGSEREGLEKIASEIGNVTFTGWLPRKMVVAAYASTDLLVATSRYEAFGYSLLEAGAAKLPIVASRVGGMPEVVRDGVDGILVKPGSVSAFHHALLNALSDRRRLKRLANSMHNRVKSVFNWEKIADSLIEVYEKVLTS